MHGLLSIGQFAEVTVLTVKALRLYDKPGLLRPEMVEFESGYRYYSHDQVSIGQRVRMLRSVHMPLAEIGSLLRAEDSAAVAYTLDRHRRYLTEQLEDYQRALRLLPTHAQWCRDARKDRSMNPDPRTYRCSFCQKTNAEISRMIADPDDVHICNECVAKCNDLIAAKQDKETSA